ncbi:MAG: type II secretion system protein, partial [Planctomycetota bacterium]
LRKKQFMGSRRKGFTLIELLVVIAIIALLMSILMPALRNVRDQAKDSMCKQRLQQWGVLFSMYASEWDGRLMGWANYAWYTFNPVNPDDHFVEHAWVPMMYDYAKSFDFYLCPSAKRKWREVDDMMSHIAAWDFQFLEEEFATSVWWPYYRAGTDTNPIYAYGSYGKNEFVTYTTEDAVGEWASSDFYLNIRVKNVAKIPLLGDCDFAGGFPHVEDIPAETKFHGAPIDDDETNRWNLDRHRLSVNLTFLDWSVRKVGLRQLWSLKWSKQMDDAGLNAWRIPNVPDWNDPMQWPEWMRNSKNYDL